VSREDAATDSPVESPLSPSERRRAIRRRYGNIAEDDEEPRNSPESACCDDSGGDRSSCCGGDTDGSLPRSYGYSRDDRESVADGANLGLGCGNPNAIAELSAGETVLDLGSGGGFDCFLAAREVGEDGRVIGVDMTPEMLERARANVGKNGTDNVEFRLGEIEHLPVSDERVDVVISNCVVNLSPDKRRVFEEAYRVLRPGGRLAIADVVRAAGVPPERLPTDAESVAGCVGGASPIDELGEIVEAAGFRSVSVRPIGDDEEFVREWTPQRPLEAHFGSASIEARKPREVAE